MMNWGKIFRIHNRCALWRMKLERAYDAGDEETVQQMSQRIDDYQKTLWEKEKNRDRISV